MFKRSSVAFHTRVLSYYIKELGVATGVARFVVDSLQHRLPPAGTVVKLRTPHHGDVFIRARTTDLSVFVQTFFLRESDISQLRQYEMLKRKYDDILRRGRLPIVIDGGGNIGTVSMFLAHLFPKAKIVLVEPDKQNIEIARRNAEKLPNVEIRRSALWSSTALLRLSNGHAGADAVSVLPVNDGDFGRSDVFPAITIDDIMSEFSDGELMLLKLDIEGAESEAIAPESNWVKALPVCIIEPHDWLIAGHASLKKLLSIPSFRDGDIVILGEYLVFFPVA
jgi:FkbM family methyltransferase